MNELTPVSVDTLRQNLAAADAENAALKSKVSAEQKQKIVAIVVAAVLAILQVFGVDVPVPV